MMLMSDQANMSGAYAPPKEGAVFACASSSGRAEAQSDVNHSAQPAAQSPAPSPAQSIEDPRRKTDEEYMRMAIEEARLAAEVGEVPIGAVVVYEPIDKGTRRPTAPPRVVARGHNLRETLRDPSAHAEFSAMVSASKELEAWRLTDCTVYVTLEPCIMCAGLMHQARVARCVYGAADQKAGALGTLYSINEDERLNHRFEVTAGVLQDECASLLKEFFAAKRKKL